MIGSSYGEIQEYNNKDFQVQNFFSHTKANRPAHNTERFDIMLLFIQHEEMENAKTFRIFH